MIMYATKNHSSSYIYNKAASEYDRHLLNTIMTARRIDKKSEQFDPVIQDVKRRQISSTLLDVLLNDNVVLLMCNKNMPAAFSVCCAKDLKYDKGLKVFIDLNPVVQLKNGFYYPTNINALIAFLTNAMTNLIYYTEPRRILSNSNLTLYGTNAFVNMFCYVLDYLRLSGYTESPGKISYLTAIYYQVCILQKPLTDTIKTVAAKIADISLQEAHTYDFLYDEEKDFINIHTFLTKIVDLFKLDGLTLDVLVEKWLYLFGTGTQFALELFPPFAAAITNAYVGAYLNQQKQIEKCIGKNLLNKFSSELLNIGKSTIVGL